MGGRNTKPIIFCILNKLVSKKCEHHTKYSFEILRHVIIILKVLYQPLIRWLLESHSYHKKFAKITLTASLSNRVFDLIRFVNALFAT